MSNDTIKYIQGLFEEYAGDPEEFSSDKIAYLVFVRSYNQGWNDALEIVKLRLIQLEKEEKTR